MSWPLFNERYRELIPEYDKFLQSLEEEFPIGIRVNQLKASCDFLTGFAKENEKGLVRPFPGLSFFEGEGERKFWGGRLEHHLGLYYLQAFSSLLPVLALDPASGENILDMCSAPGGKSAFIAERMEQRGSLICNEPDLNRRRVLKANLERMGVQNAAIYAGVGQELAFKPASFDKILLDGPCSSEGTFRASHLKMKKPRKGNFLKYNIDFRKKLQLVQWELLKKSCELLRPGGTLVYSTCTYDPEENEAQVNKLLEHEPAIRIVPVQFSCDIQDRLSCGVLNYQGSQFHPTLKDTYRVYPHEINSIGFYFAKLIKLR